jgi:soluble lytic murein transglycosylase-like protein
MDEPVEGHLATLPVQFGRARAARRRQSSNAKTSNSNGVTAAADRFGDFVDEASQRFAIPPSWIRAVMRVESLGDPWA